jgi:glycyl-radical enzyme activating protein
VTITGRVFNIQRFSVHDGPGIRTSVFLKGCNLNCSWCHNPESRMPGQEIQYFQQKCVSCYARPSKSCIEVCPTGAHFLAPDGQKVFDRTKCDLCGECVKACLYDALVFVSKTMEVAEVVDVVMKDVDYYRNSGGGITFSGGEPVLQKEFVRAVAAETRARGVHNALDTAANVEWDDLAYVLPVIDLVLLDIKTMDSQVHRRFTGAPNERILSNALRVARSDVDIMVRIPVVPTVNDSDENMRETAEFVREFPRLLRVELLPYHDMGVDKHASLGHTDPPAIFETPSPQRMRELAALFDERGVPVRIP